MRIDSEGVETAEELLQQKAKVVFLTVREQFEKDEPVFPFNEFDESDVVVYQRKDFILRIVQAGRRQYLEMLDNGGVLPGKESCYESGKYYIEGMTEKTRALYYMCVYDALCEAAFQFRMAGKMNAGLRKAAEFPRSVPGGDQG